MHWWKIGTDVMRRQRERRSLPPRAFICTGTNTSVTAANTILRRARASVPYVAALDVIAQVGVECGGVDAPAPHHLIEADLGIALAAD
jgi:hypothetical protein